jgi:hypothetical protein
MPGTVPSNYGGLPTVPVRHSLQEVRAALEKEIQDHKRDAMLYNVQWSEPYLMNQRERTLNGDAKPKHTSSQQISYETNWTGLA